ncbi:MAG: tRNA (N(6)-L-threonylcarbamoyladenosine(37)-C(2))-methylthiotransferase MtaB [Desulfobacteraceae bacterium]
MRHYTITTLGCKVNQCESSALGTLLEGNGFENATASEKIDLVVINTCTVTGKAAMQSRQAIRQAIRRHPDARIVVTGCYAQTAPDEIKAIDGVQYIVGHSDKMGIARILEEMPTPNSGANVIREEIQHTRCFDPMPSVVPESRTRAFLKIQDGCNAFCTYCIVPYARGQSRSMPVADVVHHLEQLTKADFKEVVLTGIHLGTFGKDLRPATSLLDLLALVCRRSRIRRLRISSIEPTEIDPGIIRLMEAPDSPLCPHFHIPLQSGANNILRRMGRPYTREQFADTVKAIRKRLPHAAIGVDVLVGFPGEDDTAFSQTVDLIESLDITYLHVFPFSPRKGTPAAKFKAPVPDAMVKERCRYLRSVGEKKKAAFFRANLHGTVGVLIESCDKENRISRGMSENYLPIVLPDTRIKENTIVKAIVRSVAPDLSVIGTVANGQKSDPAAPSR